MLSPETIIGIASGVAGGVVTGLGASYTLMNLVVSRALARFELHLQGEHGFLPRSEAKLIHSGIDRRLKALEGHRHIEEQAL